MGSALASIAVRKWKTKNNENEDARSDSDLAEAGGTVDGDTSVSSLEDGWEFSAERAALHNRRTGLEDVDTSTTSTSTPSTLLHVNEGDDSYVWSSTDSEIEEESLVGRRVLEWEGRAAGDVAYSDAAEVLAGFPSCSSRMLRERDASGGDTKKAAGGGGDGGISGGGGGGGVGESEERLEVGAVQVESSLPIA